MRAVNERSKKYQQQIPIRDQDAEFVRHGSAGVVSTTLDHSMNDGSLMNPEQVSFIETTGANKSTSN